MSSGEAERSRVVVTGIGVVSALGADRESHWTALSAAESGVRPITAFPVDGLRTRVAASAAAFDPARVFAERELAQMDRFAQLGAAASLEAWSDAGLDRDPPDPFRVGLALGSAQGGRITDESVLERYFRVDDQRMRPLTIPLLMPNAATYWAARRLAIRGPAYPISSACASGLAGIGLGFDLLRGDAPVDVVLAGAADAPLARTVLLAWCATRATSARNDEPAGACRPFDRARDGMVLGEGAGVLVLERLEHARRRGARVYAEVVGHGATQDAGDLTLPDPSGEAAARAIGTAMRRAAAEPAHVGWISAHGTGTLANDVAEARALWRAFGRRPPPVTAWKASLGHAMGASGAIEAATAALALQRGLVPPNRNLTDPDPECDLDHLAGAARPRPHGLALVESFAFGGANHALLLAPWA